MSSAPPIEPRQAKLFAANVRRTNRFQHGMRVFEAFNLNRTQGELDFVDVDVRDGLPFDEGQKAFAGADRQEPTKGWPAAEGSEVGASAGGWIFSVQTFQHWRAQFKATRPEDVARLKTLEKENARLKVDRW